MGWNREYIFKYHVVYSGDVFVAAKTRKEADAKLRDMGGKEFCL